jgi:hypothetical protein
MRPMVFIPLFILFASCSGQKPARFIPKDFNYPDDSIGEGKTFIFHDSVHNQHTYLSLRSLMQGSDTVQSRVRYNAMSVIDSQIISHGQMIESYYQFSWYHPVLYKAQDLIDVTTSDGTKLGLNKTSCTYHNDTLLLTISSESQFLKDTSMVWSGQLVPCLVIVSNGKMEGRSKIIESLNFTSTVLYRGYYAKDLGVIKYTMGFKDRKNNDQYLVWDLVAIEDGRKPARRGAN